MNEQKIRRFRHASNGFDAIDHMEYLPSGECFQVQKNGERLRNMPTELWSRIEDAERYVASGNWVEVTDSPEFAEPKPETPVEPPDGLVHAAYLRRAGVLLLVADGIAGVSFDLNYEHGAAIEVAGRTLGVDIEQCDGLYDTFLDIRERLNAALEPAKREIRAELQRQAVEILGKEST